MGRKTKAKAAKKKNEKAKAAKAASGEFCVRAEGDLLFWTADRRKPETWLGRVLALCGCGLRRRMPLLLLCLLVGGCIVGPSGLKSLVSGPGFDYLSNFCGATSLIHHFYFSTVRVAVDCMLLSILTTAESDDPFKLNDENHFNGLAESDGHLSNAAKIAKMQAELAEKQKQQQEMLAHVIPRDDPSPKHLLQLPFIVKFCPQHDDLHSLLLQECKAATSVAKCKALVKNRSARANRKPRFIKKTAKISPKIVGSVIGHGGTNIQKIHRATKCNIWIDQESMAPHEMRLG